MTQTHRQHAIVIGGSIAGLCAARILANHFERVTLLDRDDLPDKPIARKGIPQSQHIHVLLTQGKHILEWLFPGLQHQLGAAGATYIDWIQNVEFHTIYGTSPRFESKRLHGYASSRILLEHLVRQRISLIKNITIQDRTEVTALRANASRTRIMGLDAKSRDSQASLALKADLIVDASGRSSRMPEWLAALGLNPPTESVIQSQLGYASRLYRPNLNPKPDWQVLLIRARPPYGTRSGGIYPIEKGQWLVNFVGTGEDRPPTDEAGFNAFAQSLLHPSLHQALAQATPMSDIHGFQRTENRLRHYERLTDLPDGLAVVGDAVCAFNPVYGQGMTVAAMGAEQLDAQLHQPDRAGFSVRFQQALAQVNTTPWLMATGEDAKLGGQKPQTFASRFTNGYLDHVMAAATESNAVHEAFLEVAHLLRPPRDLLAPKILLPVLKYVVGRRRWPAQTRQRPQSTPELPKTIAPPHTNTTQKLSR